MSYNICTIMDPDRVQRYLAKFEKFEYFYNQFSKWLDQHPIDSIDPEKDAHWLYAIVHVFQNISELISDLVAMILKDLGKTIYDNYTNYQTLYQLSVISQKSWNSLRKINGLRNRIAHEYNGLNYSIAWESFVFFSEDLEQIRQELEKWLTKNS